MRTNHAEAFLEHVDTDREWAATRLGLDLLEDRGVSGLVQELLVPVQHEAGRRWQTTAYSVADEHRVTGLVDELLGVAATSLPQPAQDGPTVALVCAEGEWHASAARMAALVLRASGCEVRFLGASVPAGELERHLRAAAPQALLISCTMTAALVGAAVMTAAAHRVGVPVVLGGAAFAGSSATGDLLGGDAVLQDPADLRRLLDGWARAAPVRAGLPDDDPTGERAMLGPSRRRLVQAVVERTPGPFRPEDELEVEVLLATLDAALLLDDVEVLVHHVTWLGEREAAGPLLPLTMERLLDLLSRTLPTDMRTSRRFLTAAAAKVRQA